MLKKSPNLSLCMLINVMLSYIKKNKTCRLCWLARYIFTLTFLFQVICITLFCVDLCPKILLYRRFSYSVFVYIFGRASTSDWVQGVVFKPIALHLICFESVNWNSKYGKLAPHNGPAYWHNTPSSQPT